MFIYSDGQPGVLVRTYEVDRILIIDKFRFKIAMPCLFSTKKEKKKESKLIVINKSFSLWFRYHWKNNFGSIISRLQK